MMTQLSKLVVSVVGLAAVALSSHAIEDDRPQAILDLIADHQTLATKIHPLRYRVAAAASKDRDERFGPDSAPVRHKDRAVSDDDDPIMDRLSALDKSASTERERVNRPRFGMDLAKRDQDIIDARMKLAALEREFAALEREVNAQAR